MALPRFSRSERNRIVEKYLQGPMTQKEIAKKYWRIGEHLKRLGEPLQPDSGKTRNFAARIEAISDYARNE